MLMTTWTEAGSGADQVYDENLNESVWDNGASVWDLSGNVVLSNWDVSSTSWTDTAGQTTTWIDA